MSDVQVLIVGAGPTGLVLANILGIYGIATLVVERNASTAGEPRAVSIGRLLDQARVRGVVLRPDRYVASCLTRESTADEADRMLGTLVRLSHSASHAPPHPLPLDLAIA